MSHVTADLVVFHRIVIRPDTISEVDGLPLVTIPRTDVVSVRIAHGQLAERPLFLIAAGIALVAIGIAGARIVIDYVVNGNGFPRTGAGALLGLLLGPLLIAFAVRRGPLLEVETKRGVRRLQFGKRHLDREALAEFIELARVTGLNIVA